LSESVFVCYLECRIDILHIISDFRHEKIIPGNGDSAMNRVMINMVKCRTSSVRFIVFVH